MAWNNLALENFIDWPVQLKGIILLSASVLIFVVVYLFDINPLLNEYHALCEVNQLASHDLTNKQNQLQYLVSQKIQFKNTELQLAALYQRLPYLAGDSVVLESLSKAGILSGLTIESFKPLTSIQQEFFRVLPIQLSVSGSYQQINYFVSELNKFKQWALLNRFIIEPLTLQGKISQQKLHMNLTVEFYQYSKTNTLGLNPAITLKDESLCTIKCLRDPFQKINKSNVGLYTVKPLTSLPVESLRLVGNIGEGQQRWALIIAPDSHLYPITINTPIGVNQGRVSKIFNNEVHIVERDQNIIMRLGK